MKKLTMPNIRETLSVMNYSMDNDIFGFAFTGGFFVLILQIVIQFPIYAITFIALKVIGRNDLIK